jgi:hypothetical protein
MVEKWYFRGLVGNCVLSAWIAKWMWPENEGFGDIIIVI